MFGVQAAATASPQHRDHPAEEELRPRRRTLARIRTFRFAGAVHGAVGVVVVCAYSE